LLTYPASIPPSTRSLTRLTEPDPADETSPPPPPPPPPPPRPGSGSSATSPAHLPTAEGWLYLATVIDLFNREVVGHAMAAFQPMWRPAG
jgi:transposase InsO family protein